MLKLAIVILAVVLIPLQESVLGQPSVLELLNEYAQTQNKLQSFIIRSENSVVVDGRVYSGKMTANSRNDYFSFDLRFDGERFSERTKRWGSGDKMTGVLSKDSPHYQSTLWDGKVWSKYGRNPKNKSYGRLYIDKTNEYDGKRMIRTATPDHALMGYFYGDNERIDYVLRKTIKISLRKERERIGNSDCFVISAVVRGGEYTIWLDPNHGYNIAKAIVRKNEEATPYGMKHWKVLNALHSYENVRFEKIDGIWVPMEADIVYNQEWPNNEFAYHKIHHKRTEVKLNPDHDALGSFVRDDVPNGAQVYIIGIDNITYRWQDGELIPNIDEAVIDEIDKMTEEIMAETIRTKSTIAPMGATISELLKKYAETQDKLRSFIAKGESTIEYIKIPRQSGRMQKELCEFRTDGDRVNHRGSVWDKLLSKDKALYKSFLWDGKSFIQYRQGSQLTDSTVFIEKNDDSKKRVISTEYKGAPLMGICGGDYDRIDSILRKADKISLRQKTEKVGNSQCYVIDAVTKRGKYMVWIDPEHGYNIAKIELQKRKGDLIGSSERVEIGMLFLLENVRFEKTNDVWVPVEADMKQYQDDRISIIKWHHKRTKMTLNPDHNALGSFVPDDIPEGTKEKLLTATD